MSDRDRNSYFEGKASYFMGEVYNPYGLSGMDRWYWSEGFLNAERDNRGTSTDC